MEEKSKEAQQNSGYDLFREAHESTLEVTEEGGASAYPQSPPANKPGRFKLKRRTMIIILVMVVAIALVVGAGFVLAKNKKNPPQNTFVINTQSLDNGTLNQLTAEAGGIGKQQLTITPETLFLDSVTINKELTVKGQTFLQSAVTIARDLAVGSNTSIGGNLSVTGQISAGNLNVGSVTIGSLRLSGDLEFSGHFTSLGAAPAIRASVASGGGATASIEGSDTTGTITIRTNGIGTSGEMAVINFRSAFGRTPKVQLTPISGQAANLNYYVTRSAGFFTIETTTPPTAGTYIFDYFVTQ